MKKYLLSLAMLLSLPASAEWQTTKYGDNIVNSNHGQVEYVKTWLGNEHFWFNFTETPIDTCNYSGKMGVTSVEVNGKIVNDVELHCSNVGTVTYKLERGVSEDFKYVVDEFKKRNDVTVRYVFMNHKQYGAEPTRSVTFSAKGFSSMYNKAGK